MNPNRAAILVLALACLAGCRASITCQDGQVARREKVCPACETIKDPPTGYCPCTMAWTCRDRPEVAEQRRLAGIERERRGRDARAEAELRAAEERQRVAATNESYRSIALERLCEADAGRGCPGGTWPKLEETGGLAPEGLPIFRQVCEPLDVQHRTCLTAEEQEARRLEMERTAAKQEWWRQQYLRVVDDARARCRKPPRCRRAEPPEVRFVCVRPPGHPLPPRDVVRTSTCAELEGYADALVACDGEWVVEAGCKPPPAVCRAKPGTCCLPDGKVVRPCGPESEPDQDCDATAQCGSGGFCHGCRCLPPDARITTPTGVVPLHTLTTGDSVTVVDASGALRAARVLRVERTPVMGAHALVEVELSDGRRALASGPHPLADGRALESLRPGDTVGGARVVRVTRVPFVHDATWDLLTDVAGAAYLADGIPLRSTLGASATPAANTPAR